MLKLTQGKFAGISAVANEDAIITAVAGRADVTDQDLDDVGTIASDIPIPHTFAILLNQEFGPGP
jgi:hypothetical protein